MKPKIAFKANLILACMLFAVYSSVHSQEFVYGALIDDALSLKVPEIDVSAVQSQEFNIAEVAASSVMLKTPPVGNQYSQGSCCAWAVGYAACGILSYERYGRDWNVARRSPSFLYNQLTKDKENCKKGVHIEDALKFIKVHGICSFNTMPYVSNDCSTQPNSYQNYEASLTKFDFGRVKKKEIVNNIKSFILKGIPVAFDFYVTSDFENAAYGNGIMSTYYRAKNDTTAHACCLVGYDDTKKMFKVQNSWGTSCGDNGYIWVSYSVIPDMVRYAFAVYPIENAEYEFEIEGSSVLCDRGLYSIRNCPSTAKVRWHTTREFVMPNALVEAVYLTNEGNNVFVNRSSVSMNMAGGVVRELQYTGDLVIYADVELDGKTFHLEKKVFVGTKTKPIVLWNGKELDKSPGYIIYGTINLSCNNVDPRVLKWVCDIPGVGRKIYTNCNSVSLNSKEGGELVVKVINMEGCDKDNYRSYSFTTGLSQVILPVNPVEIGGNINAKVYSGQEDDINTMSERSLSSQSDVSTRVPYEGNFIVELWSSTYGRVSSYYFDNYEVSIPTTGLAPGVYYLKLIIDEQLRHTASVVIK